MCLLLVDSIIISRKGKLPKKPLRRLAYQGYAIFRLCSEDSNNTIEAYKQKISEL